MILICSCQCGSTDSLLRNTLKRCGYDDWLNVPIVKGRDKSRKLLNTIPQFPEVEMLDHFLQEASKWAVIIGYDDKMCRWSDIAHNGERSRIEAEFVVKNFS